MPSNDSGSDHGCRSSPAFCLVVINPARLARMNKVSQISTATTLFGGLASSLPIFICPAALYRLGHPDGEMNAVRAAGQEGIVKSVRLPPRLSDLYLPTDRADASLTRYRTTRAARRRSACP